MQLKQFTLSAILAAVAFAQDQDLTTVLGNTEGLSALGEYLKQFPDVTETLASAKNITLLAPNNEAVSKALQMLTGGTNGDDDDSSSKFRRQDDSDQDGGSQPSTDDIKNTLIYHVLKGIYKADNITETPAFVHTSLSEEDYTTVTNGQVVEVVKNGSDVVVTSGLLQKSKVVKADIEFSGGVIHIIDTVLAIPRDPSETALDAGLSGAVGALDEADLGDKIDDAKDLTLFVPSNKAFENIGSALKNISKEDLTKVLSYHAVTGAIGYSSKLTDGQKLQALSGGDLTVTIKDGDVFVNAAKVIIPNVLVSNGVVHVIDQVLNPNDKDAIKDDADNGEVAFSGASSESLAFTSDVPKPSTTLSAAPTAGGAATTSSSSQMAALPMRTGAVGAAALFGAGVAVFNM